MANIKFTCKHYNPKFDEEMIISIEPVSNNKPEPPLYYPVNEPLIEYQLPKEAIVLQNLTHLQWDANRPIGISEPQRATVSIKMDILKDTDIPVEHQKYLFDNIIDPYQERVHFVRTGTFSIFIFYKSYWSNKITIESDTLGYMELIQDIYSNIDTNRYEADCVINCLDRASWALKSSETRAEIERYFSELQRVGVKGVDWDTSRFAFDYLCTRSLDGNMGDKDVTNNNPWWRDTAPLGVIISGSPTISRNQPVEISDITFNDNALDNIDVVYLEHTDDDVRNKRSATNGATNMSDNNITVQLVWHNQIPNNANGWGRLHSARSVVTRPPGMAANRSIEWRAWGWREIKEDNNKIGMHEVRHINKPGFDFAYLFWYFEHPQNQPQ